MRRMEHGGFLMEVEGLVHSAAEGNDRYTRRSMMATNAKQEGNS